MTDPTLAAPTGANTITVCCKLQHGLKMEVGRHGEEDYETHTLKGTNNQRALIDDTGFALTTMPRAFWFKWLEYSPTMADRHGKEIKVASQPNKKLQCIVQKLVFAHENKDYVLAHAVDHANQRTGFEPLTPRDMPKGVTVLSND